MKDNSRIDDSLYRLNAGIMLENKDGLIFVGRRIGGEENAWQMPQGGIKQGENEMEALYREVDEEIGLSQNDIEIVQRLSKYLYYKIPSNAKRYFWNGKYIGQKQIWFHAKFISDDSKVNINTEFPEFCEWRWMSAESIMRYVISFKKEIYQTVFQEFNKFNTTKT